MLLHSLWVFMAESLHYIAPSHPLPSFMLCACNKCCHSGLDAWLKMHWCLLKENISSLFSVLFLQAWPCQWAPPVILTTFLPVFKAAAPAWSVTMATTAPKPLPHILPVSPRARKTSAWAESNKQWPTILISTHRPALLFHPSRSSGTKMAEPTGTGRQLCSWPSTGEQLFLCFYLSAFFDLDCLRCRWFNDPGPHDPRESPVLDG